jgi:hypothetical protein
MPPYFSTMDRRTAFTMTNRKTPVIASEARQSMRPHSSTMDRQTSFAMTNRGSPFNCCPLRSQTSPPHILKYLLPAAESDIRL